MRSAVAHPCFWPNFFGQFRSCLYLFSVLVVQAVLCLCLCSWWIFFPLPIQWALLQELWLFWSFKEGLVSLFLASIDLIKVLIRSKHYVIASTASYFSNKSITLMHSSHSIHWCLMAGIICLCKLLLNSCNWMQFLEKRLTLLAGNVDMICFIIMWAFVNIQVQE